MTPSLSPLILLHDDDNVLVVRASLHKGATVLIDGNPVTVETDIPVGHKVARRALEPGTKILKYGAPIGSMTTAVVAGAHVHLHNMQSDYIPSHTREGRAGGH